MIKLFNLLCKEEFEYSKRFGKFQKVWIGGIVFGIFYKYVDDCVVCDVKGMIGFGDESVVMFLVLCLRYYQCIFIWLILVDGVDCQGR